MKNTLLIKLFYLSLVYVLAFNAINAFAVKLAIWQPANKTNSFVIAVKDNETPEQALQRYLQTWETDPDLERWRPYFTTLGEGNNLVPYTATNADGKARIILQANDFKDHVDGKRLRKIADLFSARGLDVYAAPVIMDLGLDTKDVNDLHKLIRNEFSMFVSVGGADINPAEYNEANQLAVNIFPRRDRAELGLVKSFMDEGDGFFTAFCRGHQLGAVAAGCSLVQDIETELHVSGHRDTPHDIIWDPNEKTLWQEIFPSIDRMQVNSIHHQSVDVKSLSNKVKVAATDANGIVEALVYVNGRGITFQFHPELMAEADMKNLFDVLGARAARIHSIRYGLAIEKLSCGGKFDLLAP